MKIVCILQTNLIFFFMYHNRVFIYLYKSSPDIPSNINLCKKKKKRKGKQHIQKQILLCTINGYNILCIGIHCLHIPLSYIYK